MGIQGGAWDPWAQGRDSSIGAKISQSKGNSDVHFQLVLTDAGLEPDSESD